MYQRKNLNDRSLTLIQRIFAIAPILLLFVHFNVYASGPSEREVLLAQSNLDRLPDPEDMEEIKPGDFEFEPIQKEEEKRKRGPLRINVMAGLNLASSAEYNGTDDHLKFNSTSMFGIGASVFLIRDMEIGFSAGAFYEFQREFNSYDGAVDNTQVSGDYSDEPGLSILTSYANATFGLGKVIYILGGVNFPIMAMDSNVLDLTGKMGLQFGIGAILFEDFQVELNYRLLNSNGEYTHEGVRDELSGIEISGMLITLQYRVW